MEVITRCLQDHNWIIKWTNTLKRQVRGLQVNYMLPVIVPANIPFGVDEIVFVLSFLIVIKSFCPFSVENWGHCLRKCSGSHMFHMLHRKRFYSKRYLEIPMFLICFLCGNHPSLSQNFDMCSMTALLFLSQGKRAGRSDQACDQRALFSVAQRGYTPWR